MSAAWAKKRYAAARVEVISWSRADDARSRMVGAGSQPAHLPSGVILQLVSFCCCYRRMRVEVRVLGYVVFADRIGITRSWLIEQER